ncbi:hypothetical protein [Melissospora conviva]|uniref:hypothetical protein n=1 Tax=Melissospora conviva TaxID=3388432 RepID=UPI003C135864
MTDTNYPARATSAGTITGWQVASWLAFAAMLLAVIVTGLNRNNPDVVGASALSGLLFAVVSLITGRENR